MRLELNELVTMHPKLRGHPTDLAKFGSLALQRSGHSSPVAAAVDHDGHEMTAEIIWRPQELALLNVLDSNRVTEDGAEAVALAYVSCKSSWVVKRRFQRGERADWLLGNDGRWLALEVSGSAAGDAFARLKEKKGQVAQCTLNTDEHLAVVVVFDRPSIAVGTP